MSDYTPNNRLWRSTVGQCTFLKVPMPAFALLFFSVLFIKTKFAIFLAVAVCVVAAVLSARNVTLWFLLRRFLFRFNTFNFRQSRIY